MWLRCITACYAFFDNGIRFPIEGPFAGVGYGWEDDDVTMQAREHGITPWVAGINNPLGKYYHRINSSIKLMGQEKYQSSSKARHAYFKEKWNVPGRARQ